MVGRSHKNVITRMLDLSNDSFYPYRAEASLELEIKILSIDLKQLFCFVGEQRQMCSER